MTDDQQTLLMFKGLMASLPKENQAKVKKAEERLRSVLLDYPDGEAMVAFGFIGAELQMSDMGMIP